MRPDRIVMAPPAFDDDLSFSEGVDDLAIEQPISASSVGAVLDKVVGPDVTAVLRPQPDARSVGQPEPASFGLFIGDLQPLASPDALDPLVVDYPARLAQQPCDLAIAVAAVLLGKLDSRP